MRDISFHASARTYKLVGLLAEVYTECSSAANNMDTLFKIT